MSPQVSPLDKMIQMLYHIGVLLAVNLGAMLAFAQLPSAAPSEQALARQLADLERCRIGRIQRRSIAQASSGGTDAVRRTGGRSYRPFIKSSA